MAEFQPGERVLVDVAAGILPGEHAAPDWQPGTVDERLENGYYRVRLDIEIGGRAAVKEAAPEHVRPLR
ncbi:MAG TPA: hypothetical protein VKV26_02095 [Dehalococcoidia bacterium]|nr:hypothetical protein [Dehalococcoidia bacterium]